MTRNHLFEEIKRKQSFLCIGLDTDIKKIPAFLLTDDDPVFKFNQEIIKATHDLCIAYKPNTAFYESRGSSGIESLRKTIAYIKTNHPEILVIADAKRGDIGNTSSMYARAFFEEMDADAITVSPYMGSDSVQPFLQYKNKWAIILALTSNKGAEDFQFFENKDQDSLYKKVIEKSSKWGSDNNLMFVVGATKAAQLNEIRKIIPEHFLLIPGVGAQGGSLEEVAENGMNEKVGLIVNSSRGIIYADASSVDFAVFARSKALEIKKEMALLLQKKL